MTKVVALQTWSNGTITMDEKSVLDIDDALATDLIAKGIVADAAMYFGGGGSGGGGLVVTDTAGTLDKTWQEIHDAMLNGIVMVNVVSVDGNEETLKTYIFISTLIGTDKGGNPYYMASAIGFAGEIAAGRDYTTNSASGYPVLDPYA